MGQFMIISKELNTSRRRLLELLILQSAEERIKIYKWLVLSTAPQGTDITFGKKVEYLSFLLFSFRNHDLEQLNSTVLDEPHAKDLHGGNPCSKTVAGVYLQDSQVLMGGSMPFPVVDSVRNSTGCFVDMQPVHDAFTNLEQSFRLRDGLESMHISHLKRLLAEGHQHNNPSTTAQYPSRFQRNERIQRPVYPISPKKYQYGKYRGGESPSEPKNEFSPS